MGYPLNYSRNPFMLVTLLAHLLALIILPLSFFTGCNKNPTHRTPPKAAKGVLDLTDWDLEKDGPVNLTGEYEFYWQEHLSPMDFSKATPPPKTGFVRVPGFWSGYQVKGEKLPGHGFATYRLKIKLGGQRGTLAVKFLSIGTAFTAYLNGKRISSVGVAGKNSESTVPRFFPHVIDFEPEKNDMDLIFQVSNFHHRRGGIWESIELGSEVDIREIREKRVTFGLFLFGSILIMALYHLGLYTLRKKDRSPLYFSIFCFIVAIRLLTTGERYFVHLFPGASWELMMKLEYLSVYLAVPVFTLFMRSLFLEFSKGFLRFFLALGFGLSCLVLFAPASVYTQTLPIGEFNLIAAFVYGTYVLIVASFRKRYGALVFLVGFLVLSLTAVNDILHTEKIIQTQNLAPFGLFVFILCQAFLLSLRFAKALSTVETQRKELRETLEAYKKEILDRVRVEEALRDSHERFLTVLDSIDANVYVADMNTYEVLFMNKHMRDTFGHDSTGGVCWSVFHKGSGPCKECTNDKLLDAEGKPTGVCVWEGKNPITAKWYINYDRAVKWVDDRVVRLEVATDVTQLKVAEKALRESEEKYRTILDSIEDGYYEVDLEGNLTFFNESLCDILGYCRDELMGMNYRQFVSKGTTRAVYATFNEVLQTGKAAKAFDWEMIKKDGVSRLCQNSVSLMRNSDGQALGFRGVVRDITELKHAEEQAKRHQQQLMQADKMVALGALVSGVAHEINNPNNFIMLNTPILKEAWENVGPILDRYYEENGDFILAGMKYRDTRERIPKLFTGISDGARRIKQIIDNLKNYVRKDTADLAQSVEINRVLESATSLLSSMLEKSTAHFSIQYGQGLPAIKGNFQRLEQVMVNLIQNACQALPDPGRALFVSTSFSEETGHILVRIRDEGKGIPPETLPHITDPFFSTKLDSGGVGLGLSISLAIVKEHGGKMNFTSEPGRGTTAEVALPIARSGHGRKEE